MAFEALEDERKWRRSDPPVVERESTARSHMPSMMRFLMETGEFCIPGGVGKNGCSIKDAGSQLASVLAYRVRLYIHDLGLP